MPDYIVRSRKTMPVVDETVTATSRETAIHQVVQTAAEGEEIAVLDAKELPADTGGDGGATGATGTG